MGKCIFYNGLKPCRESVFATTCPGIKFGKCLSQKDSMEKIPAVCGLGRGADKCLERLEGENCPGLESQRCVSIQQGFTTSALPKTKREGVSCSEIRTYEGCLRKISGNNCPGKKIGECVSKHFHDKEIPTSTHLDSDIGIAA